MYRTVIVVVAWRNRSGDCDWGRREREEREGIGEEEGVEASEMCRVLLHSPDHLLSQHGAHVPLVDTPGHIGRL